MRRIRVEQILTQSGAVLPTANWVIEGLQALETDTGVIHVFSDGTWTKTMGGLTPSGDSGEGITGTAGTAGNLAEWDASGNIVDAGVAVTPTDVANWNTAFGWGDHAAVGYLVNLSGQTTTDLTEGTNLYFTDARAKAAVDKAHVDSLNVDSDTLDGQQGTQYLDRANHTGTEPDAAIPETAVTQHEGALTITESQISDLGNYLTENQIDGGRADSNYGATAVINGGAA